MASITTAMDHPNLASAISPWTVAEVLVEYLPAGDLINLARSSTSLRASLHDFPIPNPPGESNVRSTLRIGDHQSSRWRALKSRAKFACVSKHHTKGTECQPCRMCSIPICKACIVRASFKKPSRRAYADRCRYLCLGCWDSGNPHRRRKLNSVATQTEEICQCSAKEVWVCLECQDEQETGARQDIMKCFGEGCRKPVAEANNKRAICIWCDLPLKVSAPRSSAALDIQAFRRREESRQADMVEYNRLRQGRLRISRRQLRGDTAVADDPDADKPQFVRDLDTVNYLSIVGLRQNVPTPDQVYASKSGKFKYSIKFLRTFQHRMRRHQPHLPELRAATLLPDQGFARTNGEKRNQMKMIIDEDSRGWIAMRAQILQSHYVENLGLEQVAEKMREDCHFDASVKSYARWICDWGYEPRTEPPSYDGRVDLDHEFAQQLQQELWEEELDEEDEDEDEESEVTMPTGQKRTGSDAGEGALISIDDEEFVVVERPSKRSKGTASSDDEDSDEDFEAITNAEATEA